MKGKLLATIFFISQAFLLFAIRMDIDSIGGYKNLTWKMDSATVRRAFSQKKSSEDAAVGGMPTYDIVRLDQYTWCEKYSDSSISVVYFCFFYKDELYRIDIANYSGDYTDPTFFAPISGGQKNQLRDRIFQTLGDPARKDYIPFAYGKTTHYDIMYSWKGREITVAFAIRQYPDYKDAYTYRLSYFYEPLIEVRKGYLNEPDIAASLGF